MNLESGPEFVIFWLGDYIYVLHWLLYFYKGSHLVILCEISFKNCISVSWSWFYIGVAGFWYRITLDSSKMDMLFLSIHCYFSYVMWYFLLICYRLCILVLQYFFIHIISECVEIFIFYNICKWYIMMNEICYYNSV